MGRRKQITPALRLYSKPECRFEWGGAFEGYARNFVERNFWRVRETLYSKEDALAQCALIFVRCCKAYGDKVTEPAHMMALFKRAVNNEWHSQSMRDSRIREAQYDPEEPVDTNAGSRLLAVLNQGSDEAKLVISAVLNAPDELMNLVFFDYDKKGRLMREPDNHVRLNRRLKRVLGISQCARDLIGELRDLLIE